MSWFVVVVVALVSGRVMVSVFVIVSVLVIVIVGVHY